jgi:hypothetical protein
MRRKLIWLLLIVSLGTAAACAWAARERIVVEWSILQLRHGGPSGREAAANRLARIESERGLIELVRTVNDRDWATASLVLRALRGRLEAVSRRRDRQLLPARPLDAGEQYSRIAEVLSAMIQVEGGEVYEEANRGIAIAARRLEAGEITR